MITCQPMKREATLQDIGADIHEPLIATLGGDTFRLYNISERLR